MRTVGGGSGVGAGDGVGDGVAEGVGEAVDEGVWADAWERICRAESCGANVAAKVSVRMNASDCNKRTSVVLWEIGMLDCQFS